jgi:hypothetical protein
MKKFVVLFVVAALTCFGTSAFAAHQEEADQPGIVKAEPGVTSGVAMSFSGSIDIRERFYNLGVAGGPFSSTADNPPARTTNTQERIRLNVDAKVGDYLNGRISIENDWDTFGRLEAPQGNGTTAPSWSSSAANGRLDLREAWMNFMIPGIPVGIKGGHQLLQLGNGWFFRDMKYGSDAWVVYNGTGNNTLALYDVRVAENVANQPDQDIDFYGILDAYKLADGVVSVDLTWAAAPSSGGAFTTIFGNPGQKVNMYNLGISYAAKTGPIHLKAEVDVQAGKAEQSLLGNGIAGDSKFKGYQGVLQANLPMDPLNINATLAYGSGLKQLNGDTTKDVKQIITVMDNDQHYTLIYEYLEPTGALNTFNVATANGSLHTGFANTMAANIGAMFNLSKFVAVGLDYWYLQAVEKVAIFGGTTPSDKLGNEVDFKLNWKLYDNLTWNWQVGWFKHGDAYKKHNGDDADDSTAVLGMLSFKF